MGSARGGGAWPGAAALVFSISLTIVVPLTTLSAAPAAAQTNSPAQVQPAAAAQEATSAATQANAPAAPQMPGLAAVQTAPAKDQNPLGATVYSKDGRLAGAVDQVSSDQVVIGLAGYLGQGEKDVAIPAKGLHVTTPDDVPRHFPNAQYGGGNITRITVPMTLSELVAAPAYKQPAAQTGVPSPHIGTPAETKKKPPSSTQSGGPG
jgi:hypothetical protein